MNAIRTEELSKYGRRQDNNGYKRLILLASNFFLINVLIARRLVGCLLKGHTYGTCHINILWVDTFDLIN